jgi:hypothetical protein
VNKEEEKCTDEWYEEEVKEEDAVKSSSEPIT